MGSHPTHELLTLNRLGRDHRPVRPGPPAYACGGVWSLLSQSLGAGWEQRALEQMVLSRQDQRESPLH